MSKIGIQWQRETNAVLDYNRLVQPTVLKSINCRDREFWQKLVDGNPNSIRIYRHYPNWDCWQDNPERCAIDAVSNLKSEIGHVLDLLTHVEDNNEWVHSFMLDQVDAADRYMSTFIETAWQELGLRTVFLNSATGHWGDDVVTFWRTLQTAEWRKAVLGQHEYDWPTMMRIYEETGDYWLCGKWQKSMTAIRAAGYQGIRCIITEAGIDGGVAGQPMKGWKSVPNALENYAASLLWYNDLLIADEDMIGVALFGLSMEGDWGDFDIADTEVPSRIAQFPTVPLPEPPKEDDNVKIYDYDGVLRDWDWLRAEFGDVQIHPVEERFSIREGERVYEACYLRAKTGNSSCQINIKNLDEVNVVGETVVFGWADAEPHGLADNGHNWSVNGVPGPTNETGDVGPGMGAFYSPADGERGPYWCWVYGLPSDYVDGLGMLAMTNHSHLDVGYREVVVGESEPPEPPVSGEPLDVVREIRDDVLAIRVILQDGYVPPEPPVDQPFVGEYYNNKDLSGAPAFTREDEEINFEWGAGSPDPRINPDHFSVHWTGYRTFGARSYTFYALVDDGIRLWVDDDLVIDGWKDQPPTPYQTTKIMTAGQHDIEVTYYENAGGATCKVWWE